MKNDMSILYQRILNEQAINIHDVERQEKEDRESDNTSVNDDIINWIKVKKYSYLVLLGIGIIVAGVAVYRFPGWLSRVATAYGLSSRGQALKYLLAKMIVGEAGKRTQGFFPIMSKYVKEIESTYGKELRSGKSDAQLTKEYGVGRNEMRYILDQLGHINWTSFSDDVRDLTRKEYLSGNITLNELMVVEGSFSKPGYEYIARTWWPILQDARMGRPTMRPRSLLSYGTINPTAFANYLSNGPRRVRLLNRFANEFARLAPRNAIDMAVIRNASYDSRNTTVARWIGDVLNSVNQNGSKVQIGRSIVDLSNSRGGRFPDYKKWKAVQHIQGRSSNFEGTKNRGYDDYKMQKLMYMLWHSGL